METLLLWGGHRLPSVTASFGVSQKILDRGREGKEELPALLSRWRGVLSSSGRSRGRAWCGTLVFVMWSEIGFSVIVLWAAVYCFQCHSCRFYFKLHFASLMYVVYVNSTVLLMIFCFFSSDLDKSIKNAVSANTFLVTHVTWGPTTADVVFTQCFLITWWLQQGWIASPPWVNLDMHRAWTLLNACLSAFVVWFWHCCVEL